MLHGCHCSRRPIGYADDIQRGADTRAATDVRGVVCLDSSSSYLAESLSLKTLLRAEKPLRGPCQDQVVGALSSCSCDAHPALTLGTLATHTPQSSPHRGDPTS